MTGILPWDNKQNISADFVGQLVETNFPGVTVDCVSKIGEGWDNTTWLVNQTLSFRLPKHELAAKLIQNEIQLLPVLPDLGVNIPKPRLIADPPQNYPYPFYGHKFLEGETSDKHELSKIERINLAEPLASFLKKLHSIDTEEIKKNGIAIDQLDRVNPMKRLQDIKMRMEYMSENNLLKDVSDFMDFYKNNMSVTVPEHYVLAHGDLYSRHLLLDNEKTLSGVIDWGDSELIHPAVDLAIVYIFLPKSCHNKFWNIYGNIDEQTHILSKLRAIFSLVTTCWYSHKISDQSLLSESLVGLEILRNNLS